MGDLQQRRSRLLKIAALDVLEIQHEHELMVLQSERIDYDEEIQQVKGELLVAIRIKVENDEP